GAFAAGGATTGGGGRAAGGGGGGSGDTSCGLNCPNIVLNTRIFAPSLRPPPSPAACLCLTSSIAAAFGVPKLRGAVQGLRCGSASGFSCPLIVKLDIIAARS